MYFHIHPESSVIFGWTKQSGCAHIHDLSLYLAGSKTLTSSRLPADHFKYTLILFFRNPYERLVSLFLDYFRALPESPTFSDLVAKLERKEWLDADHFGPQSEPMDPCAKRIVFDVDHIHYNELEALFKKTIPDSMRATRRVLRVGEPAAHLTPVHKLTDMQKQSVDCFYPSRLQKRVATIYQQDLEFAGQHGLSYHVRSLEEQVPLFQVCIFSCQSRLNKAYLLYELLKNKMPHIYIVYGDPSLTEPYKVLDNKYLVLSCSDDYHCLSFKTHALFQAMLELHPEMTGMFKCDDDMIPSYAQFREMMTLIEDKKIDYLGRKGSTPGRKQALTKKMATKDLLVDIPPCEYAYGPLYYLSKKALQLLNGPKVYNYFEDVMVGMNLQAHKIPCYDYMAYQNTMVYHPMVNVENVNGQMKHLLMEIHGGLGNIFFQVAAGWSMARLQKKSLILLYTDDQHRFTHFGIKNFLREVLPFFNAVEKNATISTLFPDLEEFREGNGNCFKTILWEKVRWKENKDYLMTGYYQNEENFKRIAADLPGVFLWNEAWKQELRRRFPKVNEAYFLHVRRGDYVHHPVHYFDLTTYYMDAIQWIRDQDAEAFFYIVSDEIDWCQQVFKQETGVLFVEDLDAYRTLYLMTLCKKGGICANSTFSWWGSYLNPNPDKKIVFPKQWIQSLDATSIYPTTFGKVL